MWVITDHPVTSRRGVIALLCSLVKLRVGPGFLLLLQALCRESLQCGCTMFCEVILSLVASAAGSQSSCFLSVLVCQGLVSTWANQFRSKFPTKDLQVLQADAFNDRCICLYDIFIVNNVRNPLLMENDNKDVLP